MIHSILISPLGVKKKFDSVFNVADPYHLIRIRIQDLKKFVTDPNPVRILKRIQIQANTDSVLGKS